MLTRGVHRAFGYRTREVYVRERLGLDPSWCRLLLRLERSARISPVFERAYRAGQISALQASALSPLALAELEESHVAQWIELVRALALPRLRDKVERALLLRETHWPVWLRTGGLPEAAHSAEAGEGGGDVAEEPVREIGAEPTENESCTIRMIVDAEVAQLLRALLCTVRQRAEPETGRLPTRGQAFGIICLHVLREWGDDPASRRQIPRGHRIFARNGRIFARDGWRCSVPSCSSQKNLGRAPEQLQVTLGLRAGQVPLVVYGAGGRLQL